LPEGLARRRRFTKKLDPRGLSQRLSSRRSKTVQRKQGDLFVAQSEVLLMCERRTTLELTRMLRVLQHTRHAAENVDLFDKVIDDHIARMVAQGKPTDLPPDIRKRLGIEP
jgi:hypothetical protein